MTTPYGNQRMMASMMGRWILALLLVLLTACSPDPPPTVSPSHSEQASDSQTASTVQDAVAGMTFERPSTWAPWQPNLYSPLTDGPLLYLTTDSLLSACAVAMGATPNSPDASGRACQWPLATLSTDGVLVEWINDRILSPLPTAGERIEMDGATARIQIDRPGSCSAIGADETMDVLVPTSTSTTMSNLGIVACLRGPDIATSEAQLRAMLESIKKTP